MKIQKLQVLAGMLYLEIEVGRLGHIQYVVVGLTLWFLYEYWYFQ